MKRQTTERCSEPHGCEILSSKGKSSDQLFSIRTSTARKMWSSEVRQTSKWNRVIEIHKTYAHANATLIVLIGRWTMRAKAELMRELWRMSYAVTRN